MAHLHDIARQHLGNDIILFTTDGDSLDVLQCGTTNNTYATVDFGPTAGMSAQTARFLSIDRAYNRIELNLMPVFGSVQTQNSYKCVNYGMFAVYYEQCVKPNMCVLCCYLKLLIYVT